MEEFRSGFVAVVGRPNVGKSTLINSLVGEKIAIVTPHPQTTRTHLLGICDLPATTTRPAGQIVFVDTPGIHQARTPLNRAMLRHVRAGLEDRDLTLWVVDVTRSFGLEDGYALRLLTAPDAPPNSAGIAEPPATPPVILALNKIDRLDDKRKLLPLIEDLRARLALGPAVLADIVPISALTGEQVERLAECVLARLPFGPRYFPAGQRTDQPEQFRAAEFIRECAMTATREEIPHALAVRIEKFERGPLTRIEAIIYCERSGQKAILLGHNGETIKRIGTTARREIEAWLSVPAQRTRPRVFLGLRVALRPAWRRDSRFLAALDWHGGE